MTPPKINSIKFYEHRFKRAMQDYASNGGTPEEAFPKLKKQVLAKNIKFSKTAATFVVVAAALIASSSTGSLDVRTSFASFSIPSIYILFVASIIWVAICIEAIGVAQMMAFSQAFKNYFGRHSIDYEMKTYLSDVELDDFLAPPYFDNFLEPSQWFFRFRAAVFALIILAGLLPVIAGAYATLSYAGSEIFVVDNAPLNRSLGIASLSLLVTGSVYVISAFIPFHNKKQTDLIRWIFLTRIHQNSFGQSHPRTEHWISRRADTTDLPESRKD